MAKVKIVPSVYQGPLNAKDLFKRRRVTVRFGRRSISVISRKMDITKGLAEVERRIQGAFTKLDQEIDPNFVMK